MPTTLIKRSSSLKLYSVLKDRVREILLAGQKRIEREKLLAYWNTGKLVNEHIRLNEGRAEYAQKVLLRLAGDIVIDESVLRRTAEFQKVFPIRAPEHELTWSHYKALLPVKDASERERWAKLAESRHLNWHELADRIQKTRYQKGQLPIGIDDPLVEPKAGIPGLYRVIKSGDAFAIDLGFTSFVELSKEEARGLREEQIVRWGVSRKPVLVKSAQANDLYTYSAELIRVVDGDTLWMKIWTAPPIWVEEKLRLRGIDAPELGTPEGDSAKRFVTSVLNQAGAITITTTKPDKWDRYLSDIFLEMPDGEVIYLNNHLLAQGHALRYDRVRFEDWDTE